MASQVSVHHATNQIHMRQTNLKAIDIDKLLQLCIKDNHTCDDINRIFDEALKEHLNVTEHALIDVDAFASKLNICSSSIVHFEKLLYCTVRCCNGDNCNRTSFWETMDNGHVKEKLLKILYERLCMYKMCECDMVYNDGLCKVFQTMFCVYISGVTDNHAKDVENLLIDSHRLVLVLNNENLCKLTDYYIQYQLYPLMYMIDDLRFIHNEMHKRMTNGSIPSRFRASVDSFNNWFIKYNAS